MDIREKKMKKILFVVTSHGKLGDTGRPTGYYLSEVTHPWDVLHTKYDIDIVSPKGGMPPVDGFDLDDPVNKKYWNDPEFIGKISHTLTPDEVRPEDYQAIFYAGGHGAMWDFPNNRELASIAARIWENGGLVSSVCHGPAGLINIVLSDGTNLIRGKKMDSFTNAEETANKTSSIVPFSLQDALTAKGCVFECGAPFTDHVVADGRLITGQNPMSATDVGHHLARALEKAN